MTTSFLTNASVFAENLLYMIGDLPLHTLVVHFGVVMLPLSAMALIAIILVPRWRGAFVWAAMVGLVIGTGAAFVSMESGQQLADHIGEPQLHAKWGNILPWVAVLLLLTACLWLWLERRATAAGKAAGKRVGSGPQLIVGIIGIGLAVVTMGLTIVVGHTGAAAVWESRSLDSEAEEDSPAVTPTSTAPAASTGASAAPGVPTYTLADVGVHSTPADCWTVVNSTVYDVTSWIPQHPGGSGVIEAMCGKDATAAYDGQHKGKSTPDKVLAGLAIGAVGATSAAAAPAASAAPAATAAASAAAGYTLADVAAHATPADCWSAVNAFVYDLTAWIPQHPGGAGVIEGMCGVDGTSAYEGQHKGSSSAAAALSGFSIGPLK